MIALGIFPTDYTYTQLMLAHAKKGMLNQVLLFEKQASEYYDLEPSVHRLNSVLLAYVKQGEPWKAEHYLNEMRDQKGLKPDVVSYTTLIQGYRAENNLDKCWELYEMCSRKEHEGMDIDEQLMSFMIRTCAATHDSEKALNLFNQM